MGKVSLVRSARALAMRQTMSSPLSMGLALLLALTVFFLARLALSLFSLPVSRHSPIWTSSAERRLEEEPSVIRQTVAEIDGPGKRGQQWVEVVSWEPRAFIYHNFLSEEECKYLIGLAKPHLEKSKVIDNETGDGISSSVRTSSGMFLRREQDKIVQAIEKRISVFTHLPVEHGEGLQILRYETGQKYEPHFDYFSDVHSTKNGGQRMATVLMYLNDVEEGGETVFPNAKASSSSLPYYNELSECGKKGLSVKPRMGDAVLFWSMKPDATLDPASLHGACPVIKGTKWSAPKWIRVHEYKI